MSHNLISVAPSLANAQACLPGVPSSRACFKFAIISASAEDRGIPASASILPRCWHSAPRAAPPAVAARTRIVSGIRLDHRKSVRPFKCHSAMVPGGDAPFLDIIIVQDLCVSRSGEMAPQQLPLPRS
jgi:hypothetical protein